MNKTLFTILFLIAVLTLSAQTGLFEISYGTSKAAAIAHLKGQGFTLSHQYGSTYVFVPVDNNYVHNLHLDFIDNLLDEWTITFNEQDLEDIEVLVVQGLITRHGKDYNYDDEWGEYSWKLGGGHWVKASWDWDGEFYWVEYTTR